MNLFDYEEAAFRKLSRMAFDYYAGGAFDQITLRENRLAFERIMLKYRVLVDVSRRDMSTSVLGKKIAAPILIAPMAYQRLAHRDGEIAVAKAAGAKGAIMIVSTLATCSLEEVAACAAGPLWFQLYVYKDRAVTEQLVKRAEAAGYSALVLTVDAPMLSRRERDSSNRFHLPPGLEAKNLVGCGLEKLPQATGGSALYEYFAALLDPSFTWRDLEWLRSITNLPILLKGIVRADDARRAAASGVSGIVVSNHGGRQLDTAAATISVLPEIARAVGDQLDILVDGGLRRGTDVLKAVALGARAVLVGRPVLWGLSVNGQEGVADVLEILLDEFDLAMALSGCPSIDAIGPDLILN